MSEKLKIGFLGAGKMATALAQGFVKAGLVAPADLSASDISAEAGKEFEKKTGGKFFTGNRDVLESAAVIVLAVKPDQVTGLLNDLGGALKPHHLLISIAAGVTLGKFESLIPTTRVVRVMPNTPALVNESAAGYALGKLATPEDGAMVQKLFTAVGVAYSVKEPLLDAVTGLSGSGPAYAYLMIEALSDGGVAAGLPRDVATNLAAQTLLGAARMVLETKLHPGVLKDMVTSPGGTTIEGLHELEKGGLRATLINAVRAASDKSRKLGQNA